MASKRTTSEDACIMQSQSSLRTCHYDESSECVHVSINETAFYQTERVLMRCADPASKGFGAPQQCPRCNQKRSGWGEFVTST